MRTTRVLLGSLAGFLLIELLVFNTNFYASILSPESSAGLLELRLGNEKRREVKDRNQVLAVGDSRMGFFPRFSNAMKSETGYTFATISAAGTTPRCWYYMLRDVDPTARRYAAIVIPVENYDDAETWEDHADRILDLHYLIARLGLRDLTEFRNSHHSAAVKAEVTRGLLLKGLVYQADFQDFLRHPAERLEYAALARRESKGWYDDYVGPMDNVKGIVIDWTRRTVIASPNFTAAEIKEFHDYFLDDPPSRTGRRTAYLSYWFGRICEMYRGSGTRIIFFRLPRGPFIRPDQPDFYPHSSVRDLATLPNVILDQEHFFDPLEKPEYFKDPMHFNAPGSAEFSKMLTRHVRELLGPAS